MHAGNGKQFAMMLPPLGLIREQSITQKSLWMIAYLFFCCVYISQNFNVCVVGSLGLGCFLCVLALFYFFLGGKVFGCLLAVARTLK